MTTLQKHEKEIKEINKNYQIKNRFLGGRSNYTYLVDDKMNGNKYVIRIKGENGEYFVNYQEEKFNLELLNTTKEIDFVPKLILADEKIGLKISKYIEGEVVEKPNYKKVSELLKTLHTSDIKFSNQYNHLEKLNKFEDIAKKNMNTTQLNNYYNNTYYELKNIFINLFNKYLINYIKYPCHNDAQKSNFIVDKSNKYYLIDWEFSAINDYIYDIATFGNDDFNDAINLLEEYLKHPKEIDYIRLYSWRMFQSLQWYNVALAKEGLGLSQKLKINFIDVAKFFLTLAEDMKDRLNKIKTM